MINPIKIYLNSVPSETFKFSSESNNYITFIAKHFSNDTDRITFYHSNKSISTLPTTNIILNIHLSQLDLQNIRFFLNLKLYLFILFNIKYLFSKNILINLIDPKSFFISNHINDYYKSFDFIFFNNSDCLNRQIHSSGMNIEENLFLILLIKLSMSYSLKNKILFHRMENLIGKLYSLEQRF